MNTGVLWIQVKIISETEGNKGDFRLHAAAPCGIYVAAYWQQGGAAELFTYRQWKAVKSRAHRASHRLLAMFHEVKDNIARYP